MTAHYPTFPIAAHSYFSAINKVEECDRFLQSRTSEPTFSYTTRYSIEVIDDRIRQLSKGVWIESLLLVKCSIKLQNDDTQLQSFRTLNQKLFGAPTKHYASLILGRMSEKVTDETSGLWQEVTDRLGQQSFDTFETPPSSDVFDLYRGYLLEYLGELPSVELSTQAMIQAELIRSGLSEKGWKLQLHEGHSAARTSHRKKYITIGGEYQTRTRRASQRITTHEVYGHARRGPQVSVLESEGFAILLEQLTDSKFKYRRSYRYLAVALGWGVFKQSMTFRQVFEVMWRLMVIGSKYSIESAKKHAFDECYRAFRGGRPDLAGAVFLKDMTYFAANLDMWKILSEDMISYNEFVDCIEGRRTLLS